MKPFIYRGPGIITAIAAIIAVSTGASAEPVNVPAGIDHAAYDRLLRKYVNDRGLVDYTSWKTNAADLEALRDYTGRYAGDGTTATGQEKAASLINAYNALTLQWILENHPLKTIKETHRPWDAKRWHVGARQVSLNEIENDTLRPEFGYRVHAVLVCAAKSCPPLWNRAYTVDELDAQLDDAMRRWLARPDLNRFDPSAKRVELSKIFSWYAQDFKGLPAILAQYGPVKCHDCRISYRSYHWDLNERVP
jgi:hypothetical protein